MVNEKTLLKHYQEAHSKFAKDFGYNVYTMNTNMNWDTSNIDPKKLEEKAFQMFYAGVNAVIDYIKEKKD